MLRYYHKESPKYRKAFRGFFFANSPILDYNFSRFLLTNSLKSLPVSKFLEIKILKIDKRPLNKGSVFYEKDTDLY
jgi:hypothetical protein